MTYVHNLRSWKGSANHRAKVSLKESCGPRTGWCWQGYTHRQPALKVCSNLDGSTLWL